ADHDQDDARMESLERHPHDHDLRLRLQSRRPGARHRDLRGDTLAARRIPWSRLPDDLRQCALGGDAGLPEGVSGRPDERHQLTGPAPAWKSGETIRGPAPAWKSGETN